MRPEVALSSRSNDSPSSLIAWVDEETVGRIPTGRFWNDESVEAEKAFNISDGNTEKLLTYLTETTTCYAEYEAVIKTAFDLRFEIKGTGLDIAAGVCWTTALLSRIATVARLYALDVSWHRLVKLAPLVLKAFNAGPAEIVRVRGSFYDIRLPEGSVDFCMMSQAFHHADDPSRLLAGLHRVLRPGAPILIIGEAPIFPSRVVWARLKNLAKLVVPRRYYSSPRVHRLWPSFQTLFPTDYEAGDHYYRARDYPRMFAEAGFELHARRRPRFTVFVAVKR